MNKLIAFLISVILILLIIIYFFENKSTKNGNVTITPTIKEEIINENQELITLPVTPKPTKDVGVEISGYKVLWISVHDTDKIDLISNLEQKLSSTKAAQDNYCLYLVSAGFFDEQDKHIGLFIQDQNVLSPSQENSLFNGYYFIDDRGKPKISINPPELTRFALQAGPLVIFENDIQDINTKNSDKARRVMVGVNKKGDSIFLVIYEPSNMILGPTLQEIPDIIMKLNEKTTLNIISLMNLDGGSHSVFLTDSFKISELSPIGGYFCIKP